MSRRTAGIVAGTCVLREKETVQSTQTVTLHKAK